MIKDFSVRLFEMQQFKELTDKHDEHVCLPLQWGLREWMDMETVHYILKTLNNL